MNEFKANPFHRFIESQFHLWPVRAQTTRHTSTPPKQRLNVSSRHQLLRRLLSSRLVGLGGHGKDRRLLQKHAKAGKGRSPKTPGLIVYHSRVAYSWSRDETGVRGVERGGWFESPLKRLLPCPIRAYPPDNDRPLARQSGRARPVGHSVPSVRAGSNAPSQAASLPKRQDIPALSGGSVRSGSSRMFRDPSPYPPYSPSAHGQAVTFWSKINGIVPA